MKYKNTSKTTNGQYLGESVGKKLADSLSPADDGYDTYKNIDHVGTILNDALDASKPTPLLLSIVITTLPTKLAYTVGQLLDITGMVITGAYSGGSSGVIPVTNANVTGFNSSVANPAQTLTVTVDGCTKTFNISIT